MTELGLVVEGLEKLSVVLEDGVKKEGDEEDCSSGVVTITLSRDDVMYTMNIIIRAVLRLNEVDWRICLGCKGNFPWRKDTSKEVNTCRSCMMTLVSKTTLALASAGSGTGFGSHMDASSR